MKSGWTIDTLRKHILALREQDRVAIAAALNAAERAVAKAEVAADKRFDAVNEFRATLSDQATHLMPRTEAVALIQGLTKDIATLNSRVDKAEGSGNGKYQLSSIILATMGGAGVLWTIFHH